MRDIIEGICDATKILDGSENDNLHEFFVSKRNGLFTSIVIYDAVLTACKINISSMGNADAVIDTSTSGVRIDLLYPIVGMNVSIKKTASMSAPSAYFKYLLF